MMSLSCCSGDGDLLFADTIRVAIKQNEVIAQILTTCPDFRAVLESSRRKWGDIGLYTDLGEFVYFLVDRYEKGDKPCLNAAFALLETFLMEGDSQTKEVATLGIIETLQCVASHYSFGSKAFLPYLGPESARAWDQIAKLWQGKRSLMDVIRAEQGQETK